MRLSIPSLDGIYCAGLLETTARCLVMLSLTLSILFPIASALQPIKAAILLVILCIIALLMLLGRVILSHRLYFIAYFYALIGFAWSLYGVMRGTPGAIRTMPVMVIFPLVLPLFTSLYRQKDSHSLYNLFLVCACLIVASDFVYVLANSSYAGAALTSIFNSLYGDWAVVDTARGYLKFTLPNVASMIFILPFVTSALLFSRSLRGKLFLLPLVLLLLFAGVMSGRRGLLVLTLLGPALAFVFTRKGSRNTTERKGRWSRPLVRSVFVCLIVFGFYQAASYVGIDYFIGVVRSVFNFTSDQSNLARVYQFHSLMRGISESPLFGSGAGAAADYIRSEGMPWAYELYYLSFIFQYGIIGFLIYAAGMGFLCARLIALIRRKGRSSFEFYFLSGLIAFMLANATNPYLADLDYMWVIFIPYAIVNMEMISERRSEYARTSLVRVRQHAGRDVVHQPP